LAGIATIAYELVEQMDGEVPDLVLVPVGHGGLLMGVIVGFMALVEAYEIPSLPKFIGVQAEHNAPLWAAANEQPFVPRPTAASGIAVHQPARKRELLAYAALGLLEFVTVSEAEIAEGHRELAQLGFYMEPTSAVVWGALKKSLGKVEGEVVAVVSGHGLKSSSLV
jgi:threonine synthase